MIASKHSARDHPTSPWEITFGPSSLPQIYALQWRSVLPAFTGDLHLLPSKFGKAANLAKFIAAEEEKSSCKLEGGCWMSLQQYSTWVASEAFFIQGAEAEATLCVT